MTPAEVFAMRDKLATGLYEGASDSLTEGQALEVADWLIRAGWVVVPPKNEGGNNDSRN